MARADDDYAPPGKSATIMVLGRMRSRRGNLFELRRTPGKRSNPGGNDDPPRLQPFAVFQGEAKTQGVQFDASNRSFVHDRRDRALKPVPIIDKTIEGHWSR